MPLQKLKSLDRKLRTMLIATVLLIVLQAGQILVIVERHAGSTAGSGSFLFVLTSLFFIPTSLILTIAVLSVVYKDRASHQPLFLLGIINGLLSIQLALFAISPCVWAATLGLKVAAC